MCYNNFKYEFVDSKVIGNKRVWLWVCKTCGNFRVYVENLLDGNDIG